MTASNRTNESGIQILAVELTSFDGSQTVGLASSFYEIVITESVVAPVISGHIDVRDAVNLIRYLPFTGTEKIRIVYRQWEEEEPIEITGTVYNITRLVRSTDMIRGYRMHFVSDELVTSESKRLSRSYKNETLGSIARNVFSELSSPKQLDMRDDDLMGNYHIIIPRRKPLHTMSWLTTFARSNRYRGATYLFFESITRGFCFKSIEEMIAQPAERSFFEGISNIGEDKSGDSRHIIKRVEQIKHFNTLEAMNNGMINSTTKFFDPFLKNHSKFVYSYKDKFIDLPHLDGISFTENGLIPGEFEFINSPNTHYNTFATRNRRDASSYLASRGEVSVDTKFAEETYPFRRSRFASMNTLVFNFVIAGDVELFVGELIRADFRSPIANDASDSPIEPYISGIFFISGLTHIISPSSYELIVEACKDSIDQARESEKIDFSSR